MRSANHCPFAWAHRSDASACARPRRNRQTAPTRATAQTAAYTEAGGAGARSTGALAFALLVRICEYARWDSMARTLRAIPDRNEDFTFH